MQTATEHIRNALRGRYTAGEISALSRLIWEAVCGYSPVDAILHKDTVLDADRRKKIDFIVERLLQNEPIQYILGYADFDGLRFAVTPAVLIPRPETAELVALIGEDFAACPPHRLADVGTGSGCIAVSLAHRFPACEVEGWDVSPEALRVAEANSRRIGTKVSFVQRDILAYRPQSGEARQYDLMVSNPPYIVPSEKRAMESRVLDYEPHLALFVPEDDPLRFYRAIAHTALTLLAPRAKLYFEINPLFARECVDMLAQAGYSDVALHTDLSGRNRFISAVR